MSVDAVWYRDGSSTRTSDLTEAMAGAHRDGGFVWVEVHDPLPQELEEIYGLTELHPVAANVTRGRQRPKVHRYDDLLSVVVRTARYLDEPETVDFGEIQLICRPSSIVVIRHGRPVPLDAVRQCLEADAADLRDGSVSVLHAVLAEVVDSYQAVLDGLDDDVSEVEIAVFSDQDRTHGSDLVERIYLLHREVLALHRAVQPLIAAIPALRADRIVTDHPRWDAYFRDVDDHLRRQADQLQTIRELIAAALGANSAQVSLRQNDDMRRISAWVAIAAVPTMLAGIYGMNFAHMPELDLRFGYPLVVAVMSVVCLLLYRAFRRTGWL